jgi:hypothetical protein
MSPFPIRRGPGVPVSNRRRNRRHALTVDRLEDRRMMAILPDQVVTSANYTDADGDSVAISVTGPVSQGAGFTVELAGKATDNADATSIALTGLTSDNGLRIVVTPNALTTQPGTGFATMYSAGYTNVFEIIKDKTDTTMTGLGGIQFSAAIVNSTKLAGVAIGNITLDAGQAPYVDRINTQNNQQATDSTMYNPVAGLIHLGGIVAASVDSIVIDGAISAKTNNPHDLTTTNDFRSVIEVAGEIGSIVGLRSNLRASVHADSIGSIRVAAISGEITTRNKAEDLAINLPSAFSGFINSAGHLHLGFPMSDASKITGQINALGISGNVKEKFRGIDAFTDPLYIPGTYAGSISLSGNPATDFHIEPLSEPLSEAVVPQGNFPDVSVDGPALFGLRTDHGNIATVSADAFAPTFLAEADNGSIGYIEAGVGEFAGHLRAKNDIGDIRAPLGFLGSAVSFAGNVGGVYAAVGGFEGYIRAAGNVGNVLVFDQITGLAENELAITAGGSIGNIESIAGGIEGLFQAEGSIGTVTAAGNILAPMLARSGSIGAITSRAGFLESVSIQAGTDIGPLSLYAGMLGTSIVAGRDLGAIDIRAGGIELSDIRARDVGAITIVDGSMQDVSIVAARNVGTVTAFGSIANFGLQNVSIVAAGDIGQIDGRTHVGYGLERVKLEAGGRIAGVTGISFGEYGEIINAGIVDSNFVSRGAAGIGDVYGRGAGAAGIDNTLITTEHRDGSIGAVTGDGWLDGLVDVTVVAMNSIASITGISVTDGTGILRGSYDANYGSIGQIKAFGGAKSGYGVFGSRFQATDLDEETAGNGRIAGITLSANANGQDAFNDTKVHAGSIGPIAVTVHGGPDGNGMVAGEIRTFNGGIDSITVDVRSLNGYGIQDGKITASGDIGQMTVKAFNNSAIFGGEFQSRGNFVGITAEATKAGTAIENAIFTAPGKIVALPPSNPPPDVEAFDPQGNFGPITATAGGTTKLSNGIVGTTFTAIGDIGQITVTSKGAGGIVRSFFTADSDGDYTPQPVGSPRPWLAAGTIAGISVVAAGRHLIDSSGIDGSTFEAANIGDLYVDVQTVEGGNAIFGSTFTAKTAVYDGRGNFDNTGTIGDVLVRNRSQSLAGLGTGIEKSSFLAGAAGAIGDLNVTTSGASGITFSTFLADVPDLDQNRYSSTIGAIKVNTGRALNFTLVPAGINTSSFISAAGIGDITVDSVGAGITASIFNADFDWFATVGDLQPGPIASITVRVPGRNASGVTGSTFVGSSIGDISVRLEQDAVRGVNAVALSNFSARTGSIGNVTVVNAQSALPTPPTGGYAILTSTWTAATGIGSITIVGPTLGAVFIVAGQPVVVRAATPVAARSATARLSPAPGIGLVTVTGGSSLDLTLDAPGGSLGGFAYLDAPGGASVSLTANAASLGPITVASPGSAMANLTLIAQVTTLGDVAVDGSLVLQGSSTRSLGNMTVGGNAKLSTAGLATLGNLSVAGSLELVGGLPKLMQAGNFSVGSLPGLARSVSIGSRSARGTSIGTVSIGATPRTKQQKGTYDFAFSTWAGRPNAVVAGRAVNASRNGTVSGGARLFLTPGGVAPSTVKQIKKK